MTLLHQTEWLIALQDKDCEANMGLMIGLVSPSYWEAFFFSSLLWVICMNFTLTANITLSFPCWCNSFNYVTFIIQQGWSYSSREMIFSKQLSTREQTKDSDDACQNKQRQNCFEPVTFRRCLWKKLNTWDLIKFSRFAAKIKSKIINPWETERWLTAATWQTSPSPWSISSVSLTCAPSEDGISQSTGEPFWHKCLPGGEVHRLDL